MKLFTLILFILSTFNVFGVVSHNIDYDHSYSASEGAISSRHDQGFKKLKSQLFYKNESVSIEKIEELLSEINNTYKTHKDYAYQSEKLRFIKLYFLSPKEAEKRAEKRIKGNKTYLYGIERFEKGLKKLIKNISRYSKEKLREKLDYLTLLYSNIYQPQTYNIFTGHIWTAKKLIKGFHKVYRDQLNSLFPSNLLNVKENRFYTQNELKHLVEKDVDISRLDPPSSPFWHKTKIEKYDPYNEIYNGENIFPSKDLDIPLLHYKRMGSGQIKIKTFFKDEKNKKKDVTLKLGREVYSNLMASKLAKAVGIPSLPLTYRSRIDLHLGDKTYDEFIGEWTNQHGGAGHSHSSFIESYDSRTHTVRLKNVSMEAYPGYENTYYKLGTYRTGKTGLINRREYRALIIFTALVGWADAREKNVRVDVYKDKKSKNWRLLYMINDLGQSMGNWYSNSNPNSVNDYYSIIARKTFWKNNVWLLYMENEQNPKAWRNVLFSDAKWIVRQYAKLSAKQILNICLSSGLAPAPANLFAQKIIRRINNMIDAFKMTDVDKISEISFNDLSLNFRASDGAELISSRGKLLDKVDDEHDNSLWYRGSNEDLYELASLGAFNALTKFITDKIKSPAGLLGLDSITNGKTSVSLLGIEIFPKRSIGVNEHFSNGHKRFLVNDTFTFRVPIGSTYDDSEKHGIKYTIPVGIFKEFSFTHKHSYGSKKEAMLTPFFKKMLPWKLDVLKQSLKKGEQLTVTDSNSFSIGGVGFEYNDHISGKIAAYEHKRFSSSTTFITKVDDDKIQVTTKKTKGTQAFYGVSLEAYIKLIAAGYSEKSKNSYSLYNFNINTKGDEEAYKALVLGKNSTLADRSNEVTQIDQTYKSKTKNTAVFVWDRKKHSTLNEISVEHKQNKKNLEVIRGSYSFAKKREIGNGITKGLVDGAFSGIIKYFGKSINESKSSFINITGVLNKDKTEFKELLTTIDLVIFDNWATRNEYNKSFIDELNLTMNSGSKKVKNYLVHPMDEKLSHFSPLTGRMHWQLNKAGLISLLTKVDTNKSWCKSKCRELIRELKTNDLSPKLFIEKSIKILEKLISKTRNLGRIRDYVEDKNLWVSTYLDNVLYSVIPLSMDRNNYVFAKEVGSFRGHSELETFFIKNNSNPSYGESTGYSGALDSGNLNEHLKLKQ